MGDDKIDIFFLLMCKANVQLKHQCMGECDLVRVPYFIHDSIFTASVTSLVKLFFWVS